MNRFHSMIKQTAAATVVAFALVSGAAAQSTIKIGMVQPLTGAFAAAGTDVVNGAKIAVDEINAKGGVIGKKLELIIEDTKSNPTEAASVTEKLVVRDKVPVLMGASASTATLAVMPKLMEYKLPMLVETSSSSKITTAGNPYIFRIAPPSEVEAAVFAKIVNKIGIKKADFLVVNNDWGRGTADEFTKVLKEKGISVGLVERMDQGAQDMNAQLAKLKGSGADTLFVTTAVEQLSLVLKQAAALGLNVRIITTGGSQNPDQLITNVGKAADGSWHLAFFRPPGHRTRRRARQPPGPLSRNGTRGGCLSGASPQASAAMTAFARLRKPSRSPERPSPRPFARRSGRWTSSASTDRSNSKRTDRRGKRAARACRMFIW